MAKKLIVRQGPLDILQRLEMLCIGIVRRLQMDTVLSHGLPSFLLIFEGF